MYNYTSCTLFLLKAELNPDLKVSPQMFYPIQLKDFKESSQTKMTHVKGAGIIVFRCFLKKVWKKISFKPHQKSTEDFTQEWRSSMSNVWGLYRDEDARGHLFLSQNSNRLCNVWGLTVRPWGQPGNTVAEPNPSSLIVTTHSSLVFYTVRVLLHLLSHLWSIFRMVWALPHVVAFHHFFADIMA